MVCGSDVALHLDFEGFKYRFKKTKNCPWMSGIAIQNEHKKILFGISPVKTFFGKQRSY